MQERIQRQEAFGKDEGPNLILIPPSSGELHLLENYRRQYEDPQPMWEVQVRRTACIRDWPTDGIPTIRPNLGVTFIPSIMGQPVIVTDGAMPCPGEHLTEEAIRRAPEIDPERSDVWKRAAAIYAIHAQSGHARTIRPYLPDTQGVFDIAHLIYGDEIFIDLASPDRQQWVRELMDICGRMYVKVSRRLKKIFGEEDVRMFHGHGRSQGVLFLTAGVGIAEDTATLISPTMIREHILPAIERAVEPFGGAFVHCCGHHSMLFESLCRMPEVRAIDLGDPGQYDTRWLLQKCAESDTVFFGRLAGRDGEDWQGYICRLAEHCRDFGARCILQPTIFPADADHAADTQKIWHDLTA